LSASSPAPRTHPEYVSLGLPSEWSMYSHQGGRCGKTGHPYLRLPGQPETATDREQNISGIPYKCSECGREIDFVPTEF